MRTLTPDELLVVHGGCKSCSTRKWMAAIFTTVTVTGGGLLAAGTVTDNSPLSITGAVLCAPAMITLMYFMGKGLEKCCNELSKMEGHQLTIGEQQYAHGVRTGLYQAP